MSAALPGRIKEFALDPAQLPLDRSNDWQPLAFIDLAICAQDAQIPSLPPFPVIGIGDREHPLAARLDAVIEPPIAAEELIRQVEQCPEAAAVTIQLLRALEGMTLEHALTVESFAYGMLQAGREHSAWLVKSRVAGTPEAASGRVRVARANDELFVVIERPAARNAMNREISDQLFEAFTLAATDASIKAVKFRAIGPAFCAGADLTEFGTTLDPAMAHLIRARTLPAWPLAACGRVVDVHVHGPCVGAGVEMAAFAARVTAVPEAWFQLPELAMGLLPGAGGCVSVSRRIGRQRAALIMLSGQRIDAESALRWGLIDAIEHEPPIDQRGAHEV